MVYEEKNPTEKYSTYGLRPSRSEQLGSQNGGKGLEFALIEVGFGILIYDIPGCQYPLPKHRTQLEYSY